MKAKRRMFASRWVAFFAAYGSLSHAYQGAERPDRRGSTGTPEKAEAVVSLLAGFGAGGRYEDNPVNRFGAGFGGRAGVTFARPRLYLGLSFVRFLGGETSSEKIYTSTLDVETGYDFRFASDRIVVRPELCLGVAQPVTIQPDNAGYPLGLHWAPGILTGLRLSPLLVSVEFRYDMVPGKWSNAATFLAGAGAIF